MQELSDMFGWPNDSSTSSSASSIPPWSAGSLPSDHVSRCKDNLQPMMQQELLHHQPVGSSWSSPNSVPQHMHHPSFASSSSGYENGAVVPDANSSSNSARLSHVDVSGRANMVDVSSKDSSTRQARASCKVFLGQHAYQLVEANQLKKGDVLTVAQLAGIMGAKHTSLLIPLCHNIFLSKVGS